MIRVAIRLGPDLAHAEPCGRLSGVFQLDWFGSGLSWRGQQLQCRGREQRGGQQPRG